MARLILAWLNLFQIKINLKKNAQSTLNIKSEDNLNDWDTCKGLLLRLASGTNLRSGNLLTGIKWGAVEYKEGGFSIQVINTKAPPSHSASQLANEDRTVPRYIDDRL